MGFFDRILDRLLPPITVADALPVDDIGDSDDVDPNTLGDISQRNRGPGVFFNPFQDIGTRGDPRFWDSWRKPRLLSEKKREAMALDLLIQRGLKLKADASTGSGWTVDIDTKGLEDEDIDADELADALQDYEDRTPIALSAKIADAMYRGDLHKFAVVWLGVENRNGGTDWAEPIEPDNIGTISWAVVLDGRDVQIKGINGLDDDGQFATPTAYIIRDIEGVLPDGWRSTKADTRDRSILQKTIEWPVGPNGHRLGEIEVHASRCLLFMPPDGIDIPTKIQWHWANYFRAQHAITRGADEFAQTVISVQDWIWKARNRDSGASIARVRAMQQMRSMVNAIIIDKDNESYERLSGAVSGLEKMVNPSMVDIAAALGIPVTIFWGVSPGGFGTGQSEIQNYEREILNGQTTNVAPQLRTFHGYALVADDFTGPHIDLKPESREIEFNDLTPPDEKETQEILKSRFDMVIAAFEKQAMTLEETRATLVSLNGPSFAFKIELPEPTLPPDPNDPNAPPVEGELEPLDGEEPGDTEDAPAPESEPDEVEKAFSTDPLPNDAGTPRDLATELSVRLGKKIPTGRITSLAKRGVIRSWNILGGADLHSLKEVLAVIAQQNGLMPEQIETVEDGASLDVLGKIVNAFDMEKLFAAYTTTDKTRALILLTGHPLENA